MDACVRDTHCDDLRERDEVNCFIGDRQQLFGLN